MLKNSKSIYFIKGSINKLIFEGEYLNGKKHGKGKEYYYNGKLKFEGEFLNGNQWNWNNKILLSEKEYLNGGNN